MSKLRFVSHLCGSVAAALLAAGLGGGCSAATGGNNVVPQGSGGTSGNGSGGMGAAAPGFGGNAAGGNNGGFDAGVGSGGGTSADAGCAGQVTKAQQLPLDIFVMLDQSGSMSDTVAGGGTKWDAVTGALKAFLTQPGLGGISVGIQYFGLPPGGSGNCACTFDSDCTAPGGDFCDFGICFSCEFSSDSCDATDYSKADVEIAPLPGVAQPIINSMNAHSPNTGTPTLPALQGAIQHAKDWATTHPGDVVIDIFATDGNPEECDTDQAHIESVAAAGYGGTPSIATFVIGVGSQLSALNGVAAAGGTKQAFIVDTSQNVNQQFMAALNAIRGAALGCNYTIPLPASGTPDYNKVNVEYTPGGSTTPQVIPQVADKGSCPPSGNAWYYDNPSAPTQILLCDATCNALSADSTGQIDVVLGCKTFVN